MTLQISNKQRGFSILELLISLAIGVILLFALANVYFAANNVSKQQSVTAHLDEITRQVFRRLEADFNRAGYIDLMDMPINLPSSAAVGIGPPNVPVGTTYNQALLDYKRINKIYAKADNATDDPELLLPTHYSAIGYISNGKLQPVIGCGQNFAKDFGPCLKGDTNKQSVRIAYQGANISGNIFRSLGTIKELESTGTSNATGLLDCTGAAIAPDNNGFIINEYSLNNNDEFQCIGNGKAAKAQPIVKGVVEMRFRYLITEISGPNALASTTDSGLYVSDKLTHKDMYLRHNLPKPKLAWNSVVGVEVCLIVAAKPLDDSNIANLDAAQNNTRPTCARNDSGAFAKDVAINGDNRLFRRSVRTFSVPNTLNITSKITSEKL